jgi:hypothetical protein
MMSEPIIRMLYFAEGEIVMLIIILIVFHSYRRPKN